MLQEVPRTYAEIDLGMYRDCYAGMKVRLWSNPNRRFLRRLSATVGDEFIACCAEVLDIDRDAYIEWLFETLPENEDVGAFLEWLLFGRTDEHGEIIDKGRWQVARDSWREAEKKG